MIASRMARQAATGSAGDDRPSAKAQYCHDDAADEDGA
jgi:hypothetical protein